MINLTEVQHKGTKKNVKNLTNNKFTLDSFYTKETQQPKQELTQKELLKLFKTPTNEATTARDICEAINKQLTKSNTNYNSVSKRSIISFNLPIDTMQFLHSKHQLTKKHKAGDLYKYYKARTGVILPFTLKNRHGKRLNDNVNDCLIRQLDIDFKDTEHGKNKAVKVFNTIKNDNNFQMVGRSVGGCGVFAFIKVSEDCKNATPSQLVAYYEKLFSDNYDFDFDVTFDKISHIQCRVISYDEDISYNENAITHNFDFNEIIDISDGQKKDFTYKESPLMDFLSNYDYLRNYLTSIGYKEDKKRRFIAPCQTSAVGNPVYETDNGTLFLKPYSSSLQDILGSSKALHLRQLIMIYEGLETTKEANEYILKEFGVNVTKTVTPEDNKKNVFKLSKTQYISNVYKSNDNDKIVLDRANCGLGKSHNLKRYKHQIIASFNSKTVENYASDGYNVFNGNDLNNDITDVLNANWNATTFKSFTKVYGAKKAQFDNDKDFYDNVVLGLDEIQQVLTENYANNQFYKAIEIIKEHILNGGKVRFLTANDLVFDFDFIDNLVINDFTKDEILKPLHIYEYDSKKLIETISHFINKSHQKERKILGQTNRTAKHEDSLKLQKLTNYKARNLDATNKDNFDFSQGLETSTLATSTLQTGVNIYEKNTDCFISNFDDFTQLSQFFGRLRYKTGTNFITENNTYTLFKNFDFEETNFSYNEVIQFAKNNLSNIKRNAKNDFKYCVSKATTLNKKHNGSNVYWCNDTNTAKIDDLKINQESHSYYNQLILSNKKAFVEMMKTQGYDVQFKQYEHEIKAIEQELKTIDLSNFLTCVKLCALNNIKDKCFVVRNGSEYSIDYKNKGFDYWFKYATIDNKFIKDLYSSYKQLNNIIDNKKMSFENLFKTDTHIKKGVKNTVTIEKIVSHKAIVKRYAFAGAYHSTDSIRFKEIVSHFVVTQLTTTDILNILKTLNNQFDITIYKDTNDKTKAGLKASLGIVTDLKKYFGNDFVSIVRKVLKAIESEATEQELKKQSRSLIRVLKNHFDTTIVNEKRQYKYIFAIVDKFE